MENIIKKLNQSRSKFNGRKQFLNALLEHLEDFEAHEMFEDCKDVHIDITTYVQQRLNETETKLTEIGQALAQTNQ